MRKKLLAFATAGSMALVCLTGCSGVFKDAKKQNVALSVWGAKEDQAMLGEMIEEFKKEYADKANWTISLAVESEAAAKDDVINDPESAADVFAFADDQLDELIAIRALHKITSDADKVIEENGGPDSTAVRAASQNGKLYAYPMTADNGYFMYYNKKYFTEKDVQTFDGMLKVAKKNKKKVSMPIDDAWYLYAFFAGAGLDLFKNDEGKNSCYWNATHRKYDGVDVAQGILDITASNGFKNVTDEGFVKGVKDGTIIAGVSGTWNAAAVQEAWGKGGQFNNKEDYYAATKLPTFTCKGEQVQMGSFAGYNLVGINAYSKNAEYAMLLGRYLTNYDNQVKRFKTRGFRPSNVKAADSDEVNENPAIAALSLQSEFADILRVSNAYWNPARTLGAILVDGNSDETDLQTLLDTAVDEITEKY